MSRQQISIDRRQFTLGGLAGVAAAAIPRVARAAGEQVGERPRNKLCAFIKFLTAMEYEPLAAAIAELGFDGVEMTARKQASYIHPERAADELPKLNEVLRQHGLEISILTTDILRADEPMAEPLLRSARAIGVPRYRLGFWKYDLKRPILPQLAEYEPVVRDLAAMNKEIGIPAIYQNHSGAAMVGATIWDLHRLINDYPAEQIGCVFDVRHAAVEAGEAWPVYFDLMKSHTTAASFKDFRWNGRTAEIVPLGEGVVDPKFVKTLLASGFDGPLSVHVEYLPKAGVDENLAALKKDLGTLKSWLAA